MKKVIRIVLLLAIAGGGYYYWRSTHPIETGRIIVSGNLELTQVDLSFKIPGRLIELNVREGDRVKKGQIIARLDATQLQHQLARDQAATTGAQSQLQQLQTSIEYQRATLESDIATRQAEVSQAQARLEELLAGSRTQEIQQAEAAVVDAKSARDTAGRDWERAQTLFKNEDISASQHDQAKMKLDSTAAILKQSEERLGMVKEGPRKEEIAAARAAVTRAQATVKAAEANRLEVRRKEEELTARRADIDKNRAQAGMTQSQLDDTTIASPIDGVVLVKPAEMGEVIAAGTTIVSIGDIEHPWLRAFVDERHLGQVKLGGDVNLTTDSYPGKTYQGKVSFIASEAEFTPKQIQTKEERIKLVYRIKVDVANPNQELKNNMPVDAEILL